MADLKTRRPDNAPGKFYVDSTCIDCQLCQDLAPNNFACNEEEEYHYVSRQPRTADELAQVVDALESCPSRCIGDDGDATPSGE
ncbi:ferredoxin [Myxococcus sp. K15C18031901]|uniref:ferredoxin n=1 Tax=Myxococcus dinghuensis TaxID=2906761 RepID=UPI0020A82335|nr:ferredoxin [Myxococcus dinghuensis]MCP3098101.1 ferredoxin [Myxococcus dinghuensis]